MVINSQVKNYLPYAFRIMVIMILYSPNPTCFTHVCFASLHAGLKGSLVTPTPPLCLFLLTFFLSFLLFFPPVLCVFVYQALAGLVLMLMLYLCALPS